MLNARQQPLRLQAGFVALPMTRGTLWGGCAAIAAVVLCLAALIAYQRYLGVDFPFQDEWRFVGRLQALPSTGMLHYLFARDGVYFAPVEFLIWYLFYTWSHLDIMLIRYTGAVVSAATALLTCILLYRKAQPRYVLTWAAICLVPFVVCSLNFWNTYGIAMESLIKPLLFAVVLATCWAAEGLLRERSRLVPLILCIVGAAIASGIYAPGLVLLPAIVIAVLLVRWRIDWPILVLICVGAAMLAAYLLVGHAVGSHGAPPRFIPHDLAISAYAALGLVGNAFLSPYAASVAPYTRLLGVLTLVAQAAGLIFVMRLPRERRARYLLPVALSLFNVFVAVEIIAVRFHFPGFEFYPRYAVLMLSGPVSLLFWITMCMPTRIAGLVLRLGVLAVMIAAVVAADLREYHVVPYRHAGLLIERQFLMSLSAPPDSGQQAEFHITPRRLPYIYPGVLYLRADHLAMYRRPR